MKKFPFLILNNSNLLCILHRWIWTGYFSVVSSHVRIVATILNSADKHSNSLSDARSWISSQKSILQKWNPISSIFSSSVRSAWIPWLRFLHYINPCSDGQTPSGVSLLPFSIDDRQLNEIDHCSEATWSFSKGVAD